jgi:UDP-4-amino-4,6-dideoxy-N-acetyl-beta-L-altrosamine transaminase
VVFATGTAALHAAYFAAGIQPGDDVITSPITFAATANAALYLRARPVFVDIDPETGNIDPALIEDKITPRTRLIAPVHYSGHPVDLDPIHEIARKYNLMVVEDASHAIGAKYKGRKIGALSDMTTFSFHPVKPITTGEGGAVLTDNPDFHTRLRLFSSHGITKDPYLLQDKDQGAWYYEMLHLGFNFRITDIQCALGVSQLKKLDRFIMERREIVARYQEAFKDDERIGIPGERDYAFSSWHLVASRLKGEFIHKRKTLFEALREKKIFVQVHYIPTYWQPYYRNLGYSLGLCPEAEKFYQAEISLPVFQGLKTEEMEYVIDTVKQLLVIK